MENIWYEVECRYRLVGFPWREWGRYEWWRRTIYDSAWVAQIATEEDLKSVPPNYEMELRIVKVTETREVVTETREVAE